MGSKGRFSPPGRSVNAGANLRPLLDRAAGLLSAGKGGEAIPLLVQASAQGRANPEVAHMLGVAYLQSGRLAEGIEALKKAAMLAPAAAPVLNHLGVALCQAGRATEGIPYLKRAVALAPAMAEARNNLAHAMVSAGDYGSAADQYRAALAAAPDLLMAHQGLASALHKGGQLDSALAAAEEACRRFPNHAVFAASLGRILMDFGRNAEAEAALRRALALDLGQADAANNLGTLVEEKGSLSEATALYHLATQRQPELADAWFNLGTVEDKAGHLDAARDALNRAAALRPNSPKTLAALISVRRKLCDWTGLDAQVDHLSGLIRNAAPESTADGPSPFSLLSLMIDPTTQRRGAEIHSRSIEAKVVGARSAIGTYEGSRSSRRDGRIRIGYLSPDFREHPIAQLMAGVIEAHDRERFEISAWSLGPDDNSAFRKRIEAGADRFEDLRERDLQASVAAVREAELDIVVDLAGYTAHARPEILALRVAPVQVNYLGYPGTTGAPFMDYVIVDPVIAAPGDEQFYSERLVRLPNCYQANDDKAVIDPDPVHRADFGLPDNAFVFCSFSMNYKIDAPVLDAWTRILAAVPDSVLWLFRTDAAAAESITREFAARGVPAKRILFADRMPKAKHLARHRLADLFLDTFAYGAHTTASDALWAGLPVLTLRGDTFARRVGASIVTAAGMPDLVTHSVDDYVPAAVAIATTPGRAAELKARLMASIPVCPLFSTAGIARDLEAAYQGMIADRNSSHENR